MSAQIVMALRLRADALRQEAADPALPHKIDEYGTVKDAASLRWLADEFDALAFAAQGITVLDGTN